MTTAVILGVLTLIPLTIGVAVCIYDTIKAIRKN